MGDNSVSVSHILAYLANIGTESILLSTTFPRIFVQHYTEIESFFRTERFFFLLPRIIKIIFPSGKKFGLI